MSLSPAISRNVKRAATSIGALGTRLDIKQTRREEEGCVRERNLFEWLSHLNRSLVCQPQHSYRSLADSFDRVSGRVSRELPYLYRREGQAVYVKDEATGEETFTTQEWGLQVTQR